MNQSCVTASSRKSPIVLYGASSQAIVLEEFLVGQGFLIEVLFTDWATEVTPLAGVPVVCGSADIDHWLKEHKGLPLGYVIAMGNNNGQRRLDLQKWMNERGLTPIDAYHPTSYRSKGAVLGSGCQMLHSSMVGARTRVGDQVIFNTGSAADHECVIDDGVHLGPGARLSGRVKVGRCSFVGIGAVVLPDLTIGANAVIGAGAVVTRNVPDNSTFVGIPARQLESSLSA